MTKTIYNISLNTKSPHNELQMPLIYWFINNLCTNSYNILCQLHVLSPYIP